MFKTSSVGIPLLGNKLWLSGTAYIKSPVRTRYRGDPQDIQQQYGLPDRFIFCCNPCWIQDGHLQLFKTLAILKDNGQAIHLVGEDFAGNPGCPEYLEDFRQYFKALAIEDLVHILGPLPEIERIQLMHRSLFVVQPASFVGLPILIRLCQALGKPVILSDPELYRNLGYGILMGSCDPSHFAAQIAELAAICEPGPSLNQETDAYLAAHYHTAGALRKFVQELQKPGTREYRKRPAKFLIPGIKNHGFRRRQRLGASRGCTYADQKVILSGSKKKPITLATTIVPRDLDNQKAAIDSWLNIGFQVVSFNGEEEMSVLRPHFPDVKFFVPEKTAESKYGKPFIYLDDIFAYFDRQDIRICGIVNSDIHFRNSALYDLVAAEAVNSLVYGARVEVASLQEEAGIMDIWGFDYFFFDKHFIPYFPKEDFCLGVPWWDFWIPLILLGYKLPVKRIVTAHAYHVIHPRRYDDATLFNLGYTFAKYLSPPFPLTDQRMAQYSMYLRNLMTKCSEKIVLR